jgi:c-di-GMP-binding flagellar brake protein YcgR
LDNGGTKKEPQSDSPFEEVHDSDVVRDVFQFSYKKSLPIKFWLKDQMVKFEGKISALNKERVFIDLPMSVGIDQWDNAVANATSKKGQCYMFGNVTIQKTGFFIKFLVLERDDRTIKLYRPSSVYKLQRRQNFRLRLSFNKPLSVVFEDPLGSKALMEFRMLDLSSGGLSFAVPPEEQGRFPKDTVINKISFRIMGRDIVCDAQVKHVAPIKDEAGKSKLKCGVQFLDLKSAHKEIIESFVAQETRVMFSTI